MSRKHQYQQPQPAPQPKKADEPPAEETPRQNSVIRHEDWVAKVRQCPLCWESLHGLGQSIGRTGTGRKRYYRCDKCAHSWTAVVPSEMLYVADAEMVLPER